MPNSESSGNPSAIQPETRDPHLNPVTGDTFKGVSEGGSTSYVQVHFVENGTVYYMWALDFDQPGDLRRMPLERFREQAKGAELVTAGDTQEPIPEYPIRHDVELEQRTLDALDAAYESAILAELDRDGREDAL